MAFKDFVKTVKSEAGDAVEVTKLKAKISKEKANIKETYEAIGEIFYNKVKDFPKSSFCRKKMRKKKNAFQYWQMQEKNYKNTSLSTINWTVKNEAMTAVC